MLLQLLGITPQVTQSPLIPTLPPPAIVQPVEPTLEEKIKTNFYKCNTDLQWIRKDNAQCLNKQSGNIPQPKTENASQPIKSTPHNGSTGLNGYYEGQCTGYVASRRYVPPGWGNASDWKYNAQRAGWTVSSTPVAGAIAWRSGHVAYVESVQGDMVTISEQNYDWNSGIRTITIPIGQYLYLY